MDRGRLVRVNVDAARISPWLTRGLPQRVAIRVFSVLFLGRSVAHFSSLCEEGHTPYRSCFCLSRHSSSESVEPLFIGFTVLGDGDGDGVYLVVVVAEWKTTGFVDEV